MGTRSLTKINEVDDGKVTTLACIYKQYDGYPSGLGSLIHHFVANRKLVNGYSLDDDPRTTSNGARDFAAQLLLRLKQTNELGGVYLYPPDTEDVGQDYIYELNFEYDPGFFGCDKLISIVVTGCGGDRWEFSSDDMLDKFYEFTQE